MTASRGVDLELSISVEVGVEAIFLRGETIRSNGYRVVVLGGCACASIMFVALVEVTSIHVTHL